MKYVLGRSFLKHVKWFVCMVYNALDDILSMEFA